MFTPSLAPAVVETVGGAAVSRVLAAGAADLLGLGCLTRSTALAAGVLLAAGAHGEDGKALRRLRLLYGYQGAAMRARVRYQARGGRWRDGGDLGTALLRMAAQVAVVAEGCPRLVAVSEALRERGARYVMASQRALMSKGTREAVRAALLAEQLRESRAARWEAEQAGAGDQPSGWLVERAA